ncbi:NYN domain-containing protein [Corynebacterium freiburgense]|uniref:NYN domain-containing protein n=1 Tax=Corynebacterium freiburgense TaxID=556548 RepID=UPI0003FD4D9F|nr:NYN domain-containing protein [Corynebacterium freiburgense]WJZ03915.1 NYN domain protein [Corynebacterium freiburgense]
MLERTTVFVDTSYLLASFYNSWETGARAQLEIDLPEVVNVLGTMIHEQLGQPIQRQLWYDGIPESGPHRYQRALRTCDGVQLRAGQLIEWGERRTQKAVDTRLVADMVLAGVRGTCSDIVLVSGDADMIPGVQEATAAGVRVHLYGFGWDSMSSALRHACDSTTILDPREDFADCMQLQVLEGPLPPTVRCKPVGDIEPDEEAGPTSVPEFIASEFSISEQERIVVSNHTASIQSNTEGDYQPIPPEAMEVETEEEDHLSAVEAELQTAITHSHSSENTIADSANTQDTVTTETSAEAQVAFTEASSTELATPVESAKQATEPPANGGTPTSQDFNEAEVDPAPRPSPASIPKSTSRPNPSMMAPRRKLRSRYVPLPNEVWASAGVQTPFDVGQQYASWWYENAASNEQRDKAHLLSGGGLPPEIDRPLLQFACETLHEYTLSESQRVSLRDGFHSGIRGVLINLTNRKNPS